MPDKSLPHNGRREALSEIPEILNLRTMAKRQAPELTPQLMAECRRLVFSAAEHYEVPPVTITAHTRIVKADHARRWVMRMMLLRLGMRRWQVAYLFRRDLRRVRASVIGW